jgi:hypothetical protein
LEHTDDRSAEWFGAWRFSRCQLVENRLSRGASRRIELLRRTAGWRVGHWQRQATGRRSSACWRRSAGWRWLRWRWLRWRWLRWRRLRWRWLPGLSGGSRLRGILLLLGRHLSARLELAVGFGIATAATCHQPRS